MDMYSTPDSLVYNGRDGAVKAVVNMGPVMPPQRKGRLPLYNKDKLDLLQNKFEYLLFLLVRRNRCHHASDGEKRIHTKQFNSNQDVSKPTQVTVFSNLEINNNNMLNNYSVICKT